MPQPYIGARKEIAFSKESTRGVAEAYSAGEWQPHAGFDYRPAVAKVKDDPALGRIEDFSNSAIVSEYSQGSIPLRLTKDFVGHILNMVFGQAPQTSGSGTYTHAWNLLNNNQHQSYTVHVKDPIKGFLQYPLGMLNSVQMNFVPDQIPQVVLSMMGSKEAAGSAGTTLYATDYEYPFFMPQHVTIKLATDISGLGAADPIVMSNVGITINKNAVLEPQLGSTAPNDIVNQRFGVALSLEATYETTLLRDLAHQEAKRALEISVVAGDGTELTITLPRVGFEDWSDSTDNNAYLRNTVPAFAERDDNEGMITAELVNIIASY